MSQAQFVQGVWTPELTPAGAVSETRYVIETVTSAGTPTTRLDLPVDAVTVLAWTRSGELLIGLVDEVPMVRRVRVR